MDNTTTYTCINNATTNTDLQEFYNIRISYKACSFDFMYTCKPIEV